MRYTATIWKTSTETAQTKEKNTKPAKVCPEGSEMAGFFNAAVFNLYG
jgi:hypothetical protein